MNIKERSFMLITSGNQRAKAEVDCWQPALIETPAMFRRH